MPLEHVHDERGIISRDGAHVILPGGYPIGWLRKAETVTVTNYESFEEAARRCKAIQRQLYVQLRDKHRAEVRYCDSGIYLQLHALHHGYNPSIEAIRQTEIHEKAKICGVRFYTT